jgi:hypothetical protein
MKSLEVREVSLDIADFYIYGKYPSEGLFLVKDASIAGNFPILVHVKNNCTTYIGDGIHFIFKEIEEKKETQISEDFFLKTLSLIVNKEESYKN